jgi:ribose transport system substrate-binding protein
MKKLNILVSLTTDDNDYQLEQAAAAERAARQFGVELQLLHAGNDPITQSQQLLKVIQSSSGPKPDAIVFEPVGGTSMPQVARAAAAAGIGWVVLNRDAEYIGELRRTYKVPVFTISADHEEIGRIQGQQLTALLPKGGAVLYIQGPSESLPAKQRTAGMYETKPANVQVKVMRAQWTEESAYRTVSSWLRLSTSHDTQIDLIAAQDDSMAMGARKALQEHTTGTARDKWLGLPFTGCDGMPTTGQAWVRSGLLAATVIIPANTDEAISTLAKYFVSGVSPRERFITTPRSFPSLEELAATRRDKARATGI